MYISGYGKAKIGAILSADGILIPTLYKKEVLGENYHNSKALETTKTWSYQTIHTILNNETYTGHLIQNKMNTLSYKDKKKKRLPKEQFQDLFTVQTANMPCRENMQDGEMQDLLVIFAKHIKRRENSFATATV